MKCTLMRIAIYIFFTIASGIAHGEKNEITIDNDSKYDFLSRIKISVDDNENAMKIKNNRILHHATFSIKNITENETGAWIHVDNARINHVLLVRIDGKKWLAGTDYPLSQWQEIGGNIVFHEKIPGHSSYEYILYAETDGPINTSLSIMAEKTALVYFNGIQTITGILTGFISGLALYALLLGKINRDSSYFYLAGSSTFLLLLQLSDLGILYPIWPNLPSWNQIFSILCAINGSLMGCCLARRYLLTAQYAPKIDKAFVIYVWYGLLICIPVALLNHHTLVLLLFAGPATIFMLLQIYISYIRIMEDYAPARLLFVANLFPILAGSLIVLTFTGIAPSSPITRLLPLMGSCIQLVIFAVALGERINWLGEQRINAQRQTMRSRSEASAKKSFLAQISHELRTPLIGIIGLAEIEKNREQIHERKVLLDGIHRSANQLLSMTNNILDYARLDAGKWHPDTQEFSLHDLIENTAIEYQEKLSLKGLEFNCNIQRDIPKTITSDPVILQKIIRNLLSNAIKFTQSGGVYLHADISASSGTTKTIRIKVRDTGIGFEKPFTERIFQPFELADKSSTRPAQGSGIGLSLSKKLCELLGGTIGYESIKNTGTTFWFEFTVHNIESESGIPNKNPEHQEKTSLAINTNKASILAAEDNEALRLILQEMLDKEGITNKIFQNGKKLLTYYTENPEPIDWVILDWNMPIMNAEQTIIELSRFNFDRKIKGPKIAVMTAFDDHTGLSKITPEVSVWINKPFELSAIRKLLKTNDRI